MKELKEKLGRLGETNPFTEEEMDVYWHKLLQVGEEKAKNHPIDSYFINTFGKKCILSFSNKRVTISLHPLLILDLEHFLF